MNEEIRQVQIRATIEYLTSMKGADGRLLRSIFELNRRLHNQTRVATGLSALSKQDYIALLTQVIQSQDSDEWE